MDEKPTYEVAKGGVIMNEVLDIRGRITKRRKLKRKYLYRRIAVGLVLAICITVIAVIIGGVISTTRADTVYSTYTYTVKKGDTLWNIAYQNVGESVDIRDEIAKIRRMNPQIQIHGQGIQIGDVLTLEKPLNHGND